MSYSPGAQYFETDTVIDGRPCHLIATSLDNLIIAGSVAVGPPAGTRIVPLDKDLVIYADRLTLFGKIHVPGGRIEIFANLLSTIDGSHPELSTEPLPPLSPNPASAGSGTTPGTTATPNSAFSRLPKSAQEYQDRGGSIKWYVTPPGNDPTGASTYQFLASFWTQPNVTAYPAASVMNSGLPGMDAGTSAPAGTDARLGGVASIRIVAGRVRLGEKLRLTTRGGRGHAGQGGQGGGNGQDAGVVNRPNEGDNQTADSLPFPSYGGFGGDGGSAASGGNGGAGGVIEWALLGDSSNAGWFDADVSGGPPGDNGVPGAGGRGGNGSLLDWAGNYAIQLPRSADGNAGGIKGSPAVKGADGTVTQLTPSPKLLFRQSFYRRLLSTTDDLASMAFRDAMIDSDPSPT